jgi:hypothetical protein
MSRKTRRRKPPKTPLKGGLGGGASGQLVPEPAPPMVDPRTPGKDLRTIQSAVNKGWLIRPEAMSALPDSMLRIALDGKMEVRARVNAARVIVSMHGQNCDDEKEQEPQQSQVNVAVINCDRLLPTPDAAQERILEAAEAIRIQRAEK